MNKWEKNKTKQETPTKIRATKWEKNKKYIKVKRILEKKLGKKFLDADLPGTLSLYLDKKSKWWPFLFYC